MDSQIIRALFDSCIKASAILGIDQPFASNLRQLLNKVPQLEIGRNGQIQEWAEDYEEVEPGHRHISHLFALHPGHQITVSDTPELAAAARRTLERRLAHGGGHTGWSRAWIANMWARLEDGQMAYMHLMALLGHSTLPNLFCNHPPFQIDGNFGGTSAIAEMLLQSRIGEITLLPAIPEHWRCGSVSGLRARGGVEVDMLWDDGELTGVTIKSIVCCTIAIRYRERSEEISLTEKGICKLDNQLQIAS